MTIHSFLKAEKGDPDWQYSPEKYFGKEFKVVEASTVELAEGNTNSMVLRQNPTEKELLAKHIRIQVKSEAKLDLIVLNEADSKLQQVFLYDIHVAEGAGINFGIFVKNGKFNKHIIQVYLEDGAEFNSYGLMMNTVQGDTEIITKIVHQHVDSVSNQLILGVAGKESQTVFQGMTVLDKGSEGSEAHIESGNFVIGENGRCRSRPDIYTDCNQVVSSLGSTVDHLNLDKLYYLQSKGLDILTATKTILDSFQNQAINIIPYEDVREEVKELFAI
jgi:Fe-S cluster assembly scaffold protein SufB